MFDYKLQHIKDFYNLSCDKCKSHNLIMSTKDKNVM